MDLFERLKSERERLGYSQTAFAALAKASKHAQINWEKGIASPNAAALAAWSAVGLDVLYVVTGVQSWVYSAAGDARTAREIASNLEGTQSQRDAVALQLFNQLRDVSLAHTELEFIDAYRSAPIGLRKAALAVLRSDENAAKD